MSPSRHAKVPLEGAAPACGTGQLFPPSLHHKFMSIDYGRGPVKQVTSSLTQPGNVGGRNTEHFSAHFPARVAPVMEELPLRADHPLIPGDARGPHCEAGTGRSYLRLQFLPGCCVGARQEEQEPQWHSPGPLDKSPLEMHLRIKLRYIGPQ